MQAIVNKVPPLVSVVIPVYNGERYVHETLDSVLEQSWTKLEIIIVNDGSTDRSMEICRQFEDLRIRYVEQENAGLAAARNAGIRAAQGDFIGFIDADDSWHPEKVARHMVQFASDLQLGLVYSYSSLMDETGEDLRTLQKEGTSPTTFADCYIRNVIGNGSNAILRREVFSGRNSDSVAFPPLGFFDLELRQAEDYELWSRITARTQWKMACLPEALVRYRIHTSGLSANTLLQHHYQLLAMAKIAVYMPMEAEQHRCQAIAHLYWHQARKHVQARRTRQGLRAIKIALRYDWRTLNGNHFMIGSALVAILLLPRSAYHGASRFAGRLWGWWQKLQIRWSGMRVSQLADPRLRFSGPYDMIHAPKKYTCKRAMPNLLFLYHKHRLMFLPISKNASTSLKCILYREEFGNSPDGDKLDVHRAGGGRPQPGRVIDMNDTESLAAWPGYRRFVVYRDPVSRFLSAYHNRVLYSPSEHPFYLAKRLEGMGLDHFIKVTETILKIGNPLHIDEHLRPQAWYYQPVDVDYIVPIEQVSQFLETEFGIRGLEYRNTTALPRIKPSREQVGRIQELYACDYLIEPTWRVVSQYKQKTVA